MISTMLPSMRWPTPCRSGDDRSAPSTRMRSRRTFRGSSIGGRGGVRRSMVGTTADASSRSCRMRPSIASALRPLRRLAHGDEPERAFFANDLARVGNPRRGLQTRELHVDAERGYRRASPTARFRARRRFTVTGAFRSVAGSRQFHRCTDPGVRPVDRRAAAPGSATA